MLSFLSLKALWLPVKNCCWNEFVVANVSLNGLTCGLLKQFSINLNPSLKVSQKLQLRDVCYIWINPWNFHSFTIWIPSINVFIVKWWSSVSLFNWAIWIVNGRMKTKGIQQEKVGRCSLWVELKCLHLTLVFWWKKTRVTCTIAANKWANDQKKNFLLSFEEN